MFYRIFGGNGYGKTAYIFERLSECVQNKKKAFLVVPEQSAVAAEKLVIKKLGALSNLYVEVINFKRLCNRVFRELGGLTGSHLDDGAEKMLMLLALDKVSPFLREYAKSAENAEFAEKALAMIKEMHACRVSAQMLEKASETITENGGDAVIAAKLCDIALISEGYNTVLSEIDESVSDIYDKLCDKLRSGVFFDNTNVFFDSFYGFTNQEYEIISLICEQADNTYVTFSCKKDSDTAVFERSLKSAAKCKKIAESAGCELKDVYLEENMRHKNAKAILSFEKNFSVQALSGGTEAQKEDDSIEIVRCRDVFDEVKWAMSKVLGLVRNGSSFSDIVICAKNTENYVGVIDTAFAKQAIPLGMDIPETLSESALFELVISAIDAASTFRNASIIRYVKTGLSGLDEEEADLFETYVKTWNIPPHIMKKNEDWTMNPDGYVDSEPDEYTLKVVNKAREKVLVCLESLSENLKECKTVKDCCLAVYNLIQDIKRISSSENFHDGNGGVSLSLLYECLDSFSSCAADEKISLSKFVTLLKSCGKNYDTGHIPSLSDEVRFSGVDLVRCENVKHVILLGVNNGVFPSSCTSNSLITDSEKKYLKELGITLSETDEEKVFDELFLAYSVITGACEGCHISFLEEDGGKELFPSVLITAVKKLTGCEVQKFEGENVEKAFAGNEMLFEEMTSLEKGERKNTLIKYFSSIPEYKSRMDLFSKTLSQEDYLLPETAGMLYGDSIVTSYSRLEKMVRCPFSHFCAYTLKLKPEPKASLGPLEAGSIMHKILEELVPILCKADEKGNYPDENTAKELVLKLLTEHLSSIVHTDVNRVPKRFVYLYNRLSKILFEIAVNIVRELTVTKFKPCDFELTISKDADIKPFPVDIGDGCTLYIAGQIDRVDVYEKDGVSYIRIIDYKTGSKQFKLKEIKKGFNLQMLLYLASITHGGKDKYGDNIVPAGVLYSNVVLSAKNHDLGNDGLEQAAGDVSKPVGSGIFLDDDEILMAMDPTENSIYLPIGRKNGVIEKTEAVTSLEGMGELLDFATLTAGELAREMKNGLKSVTPFDGRKEGIDILPCNYCEMYPVCLRDVSKSQKNTENE